MLRLRNQSNLLLQIGLEVVVDLVCCVVEFS